MAEETSLYSFYTAEGIKNGLTHNNCKFLLNSKPFQIFSGSLHYFRLPQNSWRESIRKMRCCHLNTVCTYVPWNLHEPKPGEYDFHHNLNLKAFITLVKEEDMFLILRIGPYICSEMDLGGLPSWLLKDRTMKLRANYVPYLNAVKKYFTKLISMIHDLQFSVSGGPVIAIQIENEFGSFGDTQCNPDDNRYMIYLRDLVIDLGIKELLFTCDMPSVSYLKGSIPDVLMTANFQTDAENELEILKNLQPNKPLMVAELWSGWFDHWSERHKEIDVAIYAESLKIILSQGGSFNIYMFQGGTNFGFFNGANAGFPLPETPYCPTITSYDYGALLSESGIYTSKYFATSDLLKVYDVKHLTSELTPDDLFMYHESLPVNKFLPLNKILSSVERTKNSDPLVMEEFGQRFGFTLYESNFSESGTLKFNVTQGVRIVIFVNSSCVTVLENVQGSVSLYLTHTPQEKCSVLWLLVENLGRVNFTEKSEVLNNERRGIFGPATMNEIPLKEWNMYALDFNEKFIHDISLLEWEAVDSSKGMSVGLYASKFSLVDIKNTFVYSSSWNKGIVLVNGFNIGRYWKIGPQQTLFLSKHFLKEGLNEIIAFELHSRIKDFQFKDYPILDKNNEVVY